jgi:hypothetical protein
MMMTLAKPIQRLQECKCRTMSLVYPAGLPRSLYDADRIVRYEQDGLEDTKTDRVITAMAIGVLNDHVERERETGKGQRDQETNSSSVLKS